MGRRDDNEGSAPRSRSGGRPRSSSRRRGSAPRSRSAGRPRSSSRRRGRSQSHERARGNDDGEAKKKSRRSKWDLAEDKPIAGAEGAAANPNLNSLAGLLRAGHQPKNTDSLWGSAPGHMGAARHTVEVKEKDMPHLLGANNGDAMREIETKTGCCVRFDQSRVEEGVTVCKVYGSESVAQMGYDLVRVRLAEVAPETAFGHASFETRTIEVEHSVVGAVMGRNGELLREMSQASGAIMTFERDKAGKEGCDELKVVGRKDQVDMAERLVLQKMDTAMTIKFGHEQFGEPESTIDINVEQQFIGWVMGKSKETIKHIVESSGTTIHVKQFMKSKGYSIIRVMGPRTSVEQAHQMIDKRCEQGRRYQEDKKAQMVAGDWICGSCGNSNFHRNEACRRCGAPRSRAGQVQQQQTGDGGSHHHDKSEPAAEQHFLKRECDDAFQVDQRWVGYIIGPGGKTFKEIKETSNAKIFIDQDTKDQGFSIIRIGDSGTPENMLAREIILKKMKECKALPAQQRHAIYQQSLQASQQVTTTMQGQGQVVPPPAGVADPGGVMSKAGFPALPGTGTVVPPPGSIVGSVPKQQGHPNAMMKAPMAVQPKSAMATPFGHGKAPAETPGPAPEIWSDDFAQKYFEAAFDQIYNNAELDARTKLEKLEGTITVAKEHLAPHMEATLRRIIDNVKETL